MPGRTTAVSGAVATVPQSVEPVPDAALRAGSSSGEILELSKEELAKLEYRGTFLGTSYRVKVYNGNEDLRLTEVTIAVWDQEILGFPWTAPSRPRSSAPPGFNLPLVSAEAGTSPRLRARSA